MLERRKEVAEKNLYDLLKEAAGAHSVLKASVAPIEFDDKFEFNVLSFLGAPLSSKGTRALRSGLRFVAAQIGKEMGELESTWGVLRHKVLVIFPSHCNVKCVFASTACSHRAS